MGMFLVCYDKHKGAVLGLSTPPGRRVPCSHSLLHPLSSDRVFLFHNSELPGRRARSTASSGKPISRTVVSQPIISGQIVLNFGQFAVKSWWIHGCKSYWILLGNLHINWLISEFICFYYCGESNRILHRIVPQWWTPAIRLPDHIFSLS